MTYNFNKQCLLKLILPIVCFHMLSFKVAGSFTASETQTPQSKQSLQFYSTLNCEGEPTQTKHDSGELNSTNLVGVKVNGLWQITLCPEPNGSQCTASITGSNGTSCKTVLTTREKILARRFGDENQNATQLVVFTQENFQGAALEVSQDGVGNLDGITITSYYFTGKNRWGFYVGNNSTVSQKLCFNPTTEVLRNGFGTTFSLNASLANIIAIRFEPNCSDNNIPTVPPSSCNSLENHKWIVLVTFVVIVYFC